MRSSLIFLVRIAVALSVLSGIVFAQQEKPKAAVYVMGDPEGRDALRMAVNNSLIKSGKYQMVAVDAIDVVVKEQNRQMSGSVSDGDIAALGRDAGAQYVCVVERSELDGTSYVAIRMVSVQSKVAELADMVEVPYGGKTVDIIQWQIGSMLGMPVGPKPEAPTAVRAEPAQTYSVAPARSGYSSEKVTGDRANSSEAERQLLSTGVLVLGTEEYFASGKADILPESEKKLADIAQMLAKYPKLRIEVGGHTDNTGNLESNVSLSQRRATAVIKFMGGIDPSLSRRCVSKGYGSTMPVADNNTAKGRNNNRRIEIKALNPDLYKANTGDKSETGSKRNYGRVSKEEIEEKIRELEEKKAKQR